MIENAQPILAITDEFKVYINDDTQGSLFVQLLMLVSQNDTYLESGESRQLKIALIFEFISKKFFSK